MRTKPRARQVVFSSRRFLVKSDSASPDCDRPIVRAADMNTIEENGSSVEELPIRDFPTVNPNRGTYIPDVPALFTSLPPLKDSLVTKTSEQQDQTVQDCLPFLTGTADPSKTVFDFTSHGVPRLERENHVEFLTDALHHTRFMAYDPSRPWVVYWTLTGLSVLGQDVTQYQKR